MSRPVVVVLAAVVVVAGVAGVVVVRRRVARRLVSERAAHRLMEDRLVCDLGALRRGVDDAAVVAEACAVVDAALAAYGADTEWDGGPG